MSLAEYIERDLGAKIAAGEELPLPLTLDRLAAHYRVSLTPVRQAVRELVSAGLLRKGANRRLQPGNVCGRRPKCLAAEPPASAEDLAHRIEADLVRLSLNGEARYLREEATAAQYGISRSALRNIFHELAGSGLIDHVPRRGWRLRPFRQRDMQSFLEVREVLELKALDLSRGRLDKHRLEQLLAGNEVPATSSRPPRIDNSLHAYLVECAGNPYIQDFFHRHGPYYELLFDWEDLDRKAAIETARQHRAILEALIQRRWAIARRELARHIRDNHPILSQFDTKTGQGSFRD